MLENLLEEARVRLGQLTRDPNGYKKVLEGLITQGALQLMEPTIIIRCRQADVPLVEVCLVFIYCSLHHCNEKMTPKYDKCLLPMNSK
jgi:hypothetical protein